MKKIQEKIQETSSKIDIIMRNRLIIAGLLIIDGINFLIFKDESLIGMSLTIAFLVSFASITSLIANFKSKKIDIKSAIVSFMALGLCIFTAYFPEVTATYLKFILSVFIITNGVINTLNILRFNKISSQIINTKNNMESKIKEKRKNSDIEKEVRTQTDKITNIMNDIVDRTSKIPYLYLIINVISIILGIWLFVNPDITVTIWGLIFVYTGLSNFVLAAKSMNLSAKIRDREFKSIIFN
ncbi:MAG: DUF308 domain-containing protein [Clostridia bacterium]|nr:DUF308 domain-containing protein [Clostridia bacterium]